MSTIFDELEKKVGALSREEKADLARILIEDLDASPDPDVEQLWLKEAQQRYEAYRSGLLPTLPG